jgi:hypothetical protein
MRLIIEVPALQDLTPIQYRGRTGHRRGGRYAPTSRVKALDELLDFPHLNVLFRLVLTHFFYSTNTRPAETFVSKRESRGLLTFDEGQSIFYFIHPFFRPAYTRYLHLLTRHNNKSTGPTVPRQARTHRSREWNPELVQFVLPGHRDIESTNSPLRGPSPPSLLVFPQQARVPHITRGKTTSLSRVKRNSDHILGVARM